MQGGSTAYSHSTGYRLKGELQLDALQRSFREVVRRHESLRTTFATVDGTPFQVIGPPQFSLQVTDLSDLSASARESEVRRRIAAEGERPFDLEHGPLLRATLLRQDDDECVLLLGWHHIVFDGWSSAVFARELSELYAAFRAGRPSPLPALSIQYADYALWEKEWLQPDVLRRQLDYWAGQLHELATLELPTAGRPLLSQSFRGDAEAVNMRRELSETLKRLGRQEGATSFMVLLAGFQVLLGR